MPFLNPDLYFTRAQLGTDFKGRHQCKPCSLLCSLVYSYCGFASGGPVQVRAGHERRLVCSRHMDYIVCNQRIPAWVATCARGDFGSFRRELALRSNTR
jgi:hypothetical protein